MSSGRHAKNTKTGRERCIPLERTILLPILRKHLKRRQQERTAARATPAERTSWLFPSLAPAGPIAREKTPTGLWSSNRNWINWWDKAAAKAKARARDQQAEYWDYGPAEWRHSFGTALGMCGWNAEEIAAVMGNSPDVCRRHYMAAASLGPSARWPLRFGD